MKSNVFTVDIVGEVVLVHGTSLACFGVHDQLGESFSCVHIVESFLQIVSVHLLVGESQQTGSSVIDEVDEDVVVGSAVQCFAAADVHRLTGEDVEEISRVYVLNNFF